MKRSSTRGTASRTTGWMLALWSLVLLGEVPAHPASLTVDTTVDEFDLTPNATCSLREAVESANRDADFGGCVGSGAYGDDSILLPAGTYGLTRTPADAFLDLDNSVGDLDVTTGASPALSELRRSGSPAPRGVLQPSAVEILGAGAETTIIDRVAAEAFGILQSDLFVSLRLVDLTVRGGQQVAGAGIFADFDLVLERVVVRDNVARAADAGGGGVVAFAALTLTDALVTNNTVDLEDPCDVGPDTTGGGIIAFNLGPIVMERSTLSGNVVSGDPGCVGFGGGLGLLAGFDSVRIVNSTVSGNASIFAGGIDLLIEDLFASGPSFDSPRRAGRSGSRSSWADARGRSASERGRLPVPSVSLEHVTITANSAEEVGGLGLLSFSGAPEVLIENTLIGDNTAGDSPDCSSSGIVATPQGTNLLSVDDPLDGEDVCLVAPPDLVGTLATPLEPLLDRLRNNGGQTPTHALLPGSPALDTADDQGEAEDQRGAPRPLGPAFDIGAFEGLASLPLLSATKLVQNHDPAADTVTYRIEITNIGTGPQPDDPASDEFEDVLPAELQVVSATSSSPAFAVVVDAGANRVLGNGAIAAGATVVIEIVATVVAPPDTVVSNQGLVRYDGDADGANDATAPTDDPTTPAPADPTLFVVGATVLEIPTTGALGRFALILALLLLSTLELRRRGLRVGPRA